MESLALAGAWIADWRPDQWLLALEIAMLICAMAANSRATMLLYASGPRTRGKRLWLAAIWLLPLMGFVYLGARAMGFARAEA